MSEVQSTMVRAALKRTGVVLMAAGLVDIGVMAWCIANDIAYASSFNVFAVAGGIFLVRGNLRAASFIRSASVFLLSAIAALTVAWPLLQPMDLTLAQFRLAPRSTALAVSGLVTVCVLLGWLAVTLGQPAVRTAQARKGVSMRRPFGPSLAGLGLVLVVCLSVHFLLVDSESARQARTMAARQLGDTYRYHVSSLSVSSTAAGTKVQAVVTAWNATEVRELPMAWDEP